MVHEKTLQYYSQNAPELAERYARGETGIEHLAARHAPAGTEVLDIGCGSGRDLARLRRAGFKVTGVDASGAMLAEARARHPELKEALIESALPDLPGVRGPFGLICASAVMQHLESGLLYESFRTVARLLEEGGRFILSFPVQYPGIDAATNTDPDGRLFILRPAAQYRFLIERQGLSLTEEFTDEDSLDRDGVVWGTQVYKKEAREKRTPLNTIDSVLREDTKTTTYKFALLRALSELGSYSYKTAEWYADGKVGIGLDLLAEKWLNYYWPLVCTPEFISQGQSITNDMAFRPALKKFAASFDKCSLNLYLSTRERGGLTAEQRVKEKELLQSITETMKKGPITYSGSDKTGGKLFSHRQGKLLMDADLWTEFSLMGQWIEDSIIIRWADFSASRPVNRTKGIKVPQVLELLLHSLEVKRDVYLADKILKEFDSQECVWTGKTLKKWDIDHALPFSIWRNNDLWNLFPAAAAVNNRKRNKLPSRNAITHSKTRILRYWDMYFESAPKAFLHQAGRFCGENFPDFSQPVKQNLFLAFNETAEVTARQQGAVRWSP